jgi:uncharacterized membrane protein YfcA
LPIAKPIARFTETIWRDMQQALGTRGNIMDLTAISVMFVALMLGAIAKGATGMGLPLIALPVLASFLGLPHAIGLMLVPVILTNLVQAWQCREHRSSPRLRFMPLFLVGCAIGMMAGTAVLVALPERALEIVLGSILLGYLVLRLSNPHFAVSTEQAQKFGPYVGAAGGVLQGATGISAPIGVTFIHAMGLDRGVHLFAVSAMFLCYTLVQLPSLVVAGVMKPEWLVEGVFALIPMALFMPVGLWLGQKMSQKVFNTVILWFLAIIGAKMLLGV